MMKYCPIFVIFIVFLSGWSFGVSAQNVTFNDANLAAKVRAALGLGATDPITQTNLANLTALGAIKAEITDLTGLEHATNLTSLLIQNNRVSDLSPLSGLTKLQTLIFSNNLSNDRNDFNKVTDLSQLKNLTNLTDLQFTNNKVSDISDLSGLTKLETLIFSNSYTSVVNKWQERNSVTDLSVLKNLTSLTVLEFKANNFENEHGGPTDISPLSGLTSLTALSIDDNSIRSIDALKELTNLTWLSVRFHSIRDLTPLRKLTQLQNLLLDGNNIRDVSPLSGLTQLEGLWLGYNDIRDVSPLAGLTLLMDISLSGNPLDMRTLHALSGLTTLTSSLEILTLNCTRGVPDFSALPVFPNLTSLHLTGWNLSDISGIADSGMTGITVLELSDNNLDGDDINDLQELTSLTELAMAGNNINDISGLSALTSLKNLYIADNDISDITVLSGLSELVNLDLYNNPVPDISPLVGLTKLKALHVNADVDTSALPASVTVKNEPVPVTRCPKAVPLSGGSFEIGSGRSSPLGPVSFSELMFVSKGGIDSLPQWIELYNNSKTEPVNLKGWRLEIEGRDAKGEHQYAVITLRDLMVPPQQVALIVTGDAPNSVNIPEERLYNFFDHHRRVFKQNLPQNQNKVIGQNGFCLVLSDPNGDVSDIIGNLDGDRQTADAPTWELPSGETDEGFRTSLLRRYEPETDSPLDGSLLDSCWRAADVALEIRSYWGKETDIGNPGYSDQGRPPLSPPLISFSELMFTSRGGLHSLPQWIEFYNGSGTETVDLRDWKLRIESLDEKGERRFGVVTLGELRILPRQTALIVTERGRQSRQISRTPVYSLRARDVFKHRRHQVENRVFGQHGFFLKLSDPNGVVSDVVGNLDGQAATEDKPKWEMPSGETPRGFRTSLMRRYYRATGIPLDGKVRENWRRAVDLDLEVVTYWGRQTDIGTPGHIGSDRLPPGRVSFSELMFPVSSGFGSLPQWIELYNASETETVDLRDWELEIEGRDETGEHRYGVITLQSLLIPPRQTALLVTGLGSNGGDVSRDRIYDLSRYHRNIFRQPWSGNRRQVLGKTGFFLRLSAPDGGISDVVGNLDGDRLTTDAPIWELPPGEVDKGARTSSRTSLMRRYHEASMPLDGTMLANWVRAVDVDLKIVTYYGRTTDVGNPGYTNDERLSPRAPVSISELMLTSRGGLHSLPQWIEVYNASETEAVELRGWHLEIESRDETGEHRFGVVTLGELRILPRQTALIVTERGRSSEDIMPDSVYYLHPRSVFKERRHQVQNRLLSESGFFLKLSDPKGVVRDIVGNLDGVKTTSDKPKWELPPGETSDRFRASLMRRYYHVTGIPLDGRASANWVPATNLPLRVLTYWGRDTDIGNPGYRGKDPLPVTLSRFRPERTVTGHVVIKWTTASEKDNAGFNILRSQQRQGQFVRLNPKLIPGAGTTSERHDYTWKDTTANPRVVYYYRLEDVSFSGQQRQLGTVRLRGHVSAGGKLMMRWSDLKQKK